MEIDRDAMQEAFSDFGMTFDEDDTDLMDKLARFMTIYGVSQEDLTDEILAMLVNLKKKNFDSSLLDSVEKKLSSKAGKMKGKAGGSSAKRPALTDLRVPLREKVLRLDTSEDDLNESCATIDMDCSVMSELADPKSGSVPLPPHYRTFALAQNSPGSSKYYARRDKGTKVVEHVGKFYEKGIADGEVVINVLSKNPSNIYATEKAVNVIEEKYHWLQDFSEAIRKEHPSIEEFVNPAEMNTTEVHVYGELISDAPASMKLEETSVAIQCDDDAGTVVKLDLSNLTEFSLFPGQAVCFRGVNDDGEKFTPSQQIFPAAMPQANLEHTSDTLCVWSACGPFTWGESAGFEPLMDLLEKAKEEQPDVLILMGPFIDRKNNFFSSASNDRTYKELMDQLMINVGQFMRGSRTHLVIQPSPTRDSSLIPMFPQSPIQLSDEAMRKLHGTNITFVSDPCVVRINGVEIALTGNEAISHLSKMEWYKAENKENTDRFARLYSNFFSQCSLLPLSPVDLPVDMERSLKSCQLSKIPHLLMNPSVLNAQVKIVCGCICINQGYLCRGSTGGSYLKTEIAIGRAPEGPTSVADYSNVQVVKI